MSDHLRRERDDLHEPLVAQLAPYRSENAGRARLALIGDEHRGVLVETDVGAIFALGLLGRAYDHRLHHLALFDLAGGNGVLDRHDDDVAQPRVAALGPAEHADHERSPRARVVRDLENRFLLYHAPPSWSPPLLRALDDFDHAPPFGLRQRPRLDDPHRVAGLGALLVVRGDLLGANDLLAVKPVGEAAGQRDRHGLLHLVAHHHARPNLAPPPHAPFLSDRMVWIRAIPRRMARSCQRVPRASVAPPNPQPQRASGHTTTLRRRASSHA